MSGGVRGCLGCAFVSGTAQVELRSGRVYAPAARCAMRCSDRSTSTDSASVCAAAVSPAARCCADNAASALARSAVSGCKLNLKAEL